MKKIFYCLIILIFCIQCKENDVDPKSIEIEAQFGEPFTVVSVPAKVTFKEIPIELYFESFTEYAFRNIVSPRTTVSAIYRNGSHKFPFKIKHLLVRELYDNEDSLNGKLLNPDKNLFFEMALLDSGYLLTFEKAYLEEGNPYDPGKQMLSVDSAVFILKGMDQ